MTALAARAAFVVALVLGSSPALADANSAAAEALFREAVALAQKGELTQALEKFKASYQIEPALGTLQGMALANEKLGRLSRAWADYRELFDRARAARDKKRLDFAKQRISALEPRLAKLSLVASGKTPEDAEIFLDGTPLPGGALGTTFPVDPGPHIVRGSAKDGSSFIRQLDLAEGQTAEVVVSWASPAPVQKRAPAPTRHVESPQSVDTQSASPSTSMRTIGLVVGGVGVVLAGSGTYLWLKSNATYDEVSDLCPNDQCPSTARDKVDAGKQQETLGRIGLIAGGVAIAAGATLFVVGMPREKRTSAVQPYFGPGSAGIRGSF